MKLSKNFSLSEMTRSYTATKKGIENTPNDPQIENLRILCDNVLQPLRDALGPITISSGFRSIKLNTAIGGSGTSQHCALKGAASDIDLGSRNAEVFNYIKDNKTIWEQEPLRCLASEGELMSFKHEGFWQPMDTLRDKMKLDELLQQNKAPWKVWK